MFTILAIAAFAMERAHFFNFAPTFTLMDWDDEHALVTFKRYAGRTFVTDFAIHTGGLGVV